ncbi:hypothetical protein [Haliangium ochraceum]|uniref:hypothetical protein n=1 Tax=Haliangium ochraceum TaxID=80816 RepID=UPI00019B9D7F|nr:hypothetical protein [Haliangium ochraceum]
MGPLRLVIGLEGRHLRCGAETLVGRHTRRRCEFVLRVHVLRGTPSMKRVAPLFTGRGKRRLLSRPLGGNNRLSVGAELGTDIERKRRAWIARLLANASEIRSDLVRHALPSTRFPEADAAATVAAQHVSALRGEGLESNEHLHRRAFGGWRGGAAPHPLFYL